jgi:hypothetical protein
VPEHEVNAWPRTRPRKAGNGECDKGSVSFRAADSNWSFRRENASRDIRFQPEAREEER